MCTIEKKKIERILFFFSWKIWKSQIGKLKSMWSEFVIKGE